MSGDKVVMDAGRCGAVLEPDEEHAGHLCCAPVGHGAEHRCECGAEWGWVGGQMNWKRLQLPEGAKTLEKWDDLIAQRIGSEDRDALFADLDHAPSPAAVVFTVLGYFDRVAE